MIQINLLPGAKKTTTSRQSGVDLSALRLGFAGMFKDKWLIGSSVAIVASLGAVGFLYTSQGARDAELESHRASAIADSTKYANFLKDRYHAEAVRDTLLRQVNIIKSLDEDRYVWPHIMDEISRALPQYTWLTVVGFTGTPQGSNNVVVTPKTAQDTSAKNKNRPPKRMDTNIPKDVISLRIMGQTVDIQAVTRFMRDLEASPFLTNVQLDKSEAAVDQGKEVTQFQLTLGYSRPDTLLLHRVPLTLSTR